MKTRVSSLIGFLSVLSTTACFGMRSSSGGGEVEEPTGVAPRKIDVNGVALPPEHEIRALATDLTYPTGITFDEQGQAYVVESGYSYGESFMTARLLRLDGGDRVTEIARSENGPWNGVDYRDGHFFVAEGGVKGGGRILRITPDGNITVIADGLPSYGDHHTNGPIVGADGWVYFGQGTATNSGIVGEDNYKFGWLNRFGDFHDIPCQDVQLLGINYDSKDPRDPQERKVSTGAYLPFGTPSRSGQTIPGKVPCSGAVMRVRATATGPETPELVAWGFRNPFGLAFAPDGTLYVTDNGFDVRGSRPIFGAADMMWRVQPGLWYGWPDFSEGRPVQDPRYKTPERDDAPRFVIANHPNRPPKPAAFFAVHSSSNGFDFSRSDEFGYVGQAFVAQFGDQAPVVGKVMNPVGFKVVRVDPQTGVIADFAVNNGEHNAPASKLGNGGLERPIAARFDRQGRNLYVVDFGELRMSEEGSLPRPGTGVVWMISRKTAAAPVAAR